MSMHAKGESALCAIIPYFNPVGYKGAVERYRRTIESLKRQGVPYFTVEAALEGQEFELSDPDVIRLHAKDCLWHKEAMINAALKHIPKRYTSIAWIDRDILFLNDNWLAEAEEALQHFTVIQLFTNMQDLGPTHDVILDRPGAAAAYMQDLDPFDGTGATYHGGGWAMRRALLEEHGLFDLALVGGGDTLFLYACIGNTSEVPRWLHVFNEHIRNACGRWAVAMSTAIDGSVGYISGRAQHIWHGDLCNREYHKRHALLAHLDLERDLTRNSNGLWEWAAAADPQMQEAVNAYFRDRKEDGAHKAVLSFTKDWFSSHVPTLKNILAPYAGKANVQFLEIGSFEGRSSCWFLQNILTHPSSNLTCIDTFAGSQEHQAEDIETDRLEQRFDQNIAAIGAKDRMKKCKGRSGDFLRTLPNLHYDCIYIDGSHLAKDVLTDAVLAWPLLKPGGILVFDDYEHDLYSEERNNPKAAIDAFLSAFHEEIDVLKIGWQFILRKRSEPSKPPKLRKRSAKPAIRRCVTL